MEFGGGCNHERGSDAHRVLYQESGESDPAARREEGVGQRPAGVLSDVCSALRACADILPDLINWGPAQLIGPMTDDQRRRWAAIAGF
jgi:hypothetical protein